MKLIKHVLLATDGSENALHAASFAADMARMVGAEMTIMTVHNEDAIMLNAMGPALWPGTVPYSAMQPEEIRSAVEANGDETIIAPTAQACSDRAQLRPSVQLWGHAAEEICRWAGDNDVDIIFLGTRGRSSFTKLLLGGVSSQVASHAPCPVTLVR